MTIFSIIIFSPTNILATPTSWPNKFFDFFQSNFPDDLAFCVKQDGGIYATGSIFKEKVCNKWDKKISFGAGAQGPKGDKGDQGDPGSPGTNGISGWEKVTTTSASNTEQLKTVILTCPQNKKVLSGGFVVNSSTVTYYTVANFPSADNTWTVSVHRSSTTTPWDLTTYAICANTN